jgi:hypothetical protein
MTATDVGNTFLKQIKTRQGFPVETGTPITISTTANRTGALTAVDFGSLRFGSFYTTAAVALLAEDIGPHVRAIFVNGNPANTTMTMPSAAAVLALLRKRLHPSLIRNGLSWKFSIHQLDGVFSTTLAVGPHQLRGSGSLVMGPKATTDFTLRLVDATTGLLEIFSEGAH